MDKTLIAIYSCQRDEVNGRNNAIRQTWLRHLPEGVDYKFFIGTQSQNLGGEWNLNDTIFLPVYDGGDKLVYKEQAIYQWAVDQGYDFVLKTETDAYLRVKEILSLPYKQYDYFGSFHHDGPGTLYHGTEFYDFAQGHCMVLSRRAVQVLAERLAETAEAGPNNDRLIGKNKVSLNTTLRCADVWVSQVLHRDGRFQMKHQSFGDGPLSWHCPNEQSKTRDKQWYSSVVIEFLHEKEAVYGVR